MPRGSKHKEEDDLEAQLLSVIGASSSSKKKSTKRKKRESSSSDSDSSSSSSSSSSDDSMPEVIEQAEPPRRPIKKRERAASDGEDSDASEPEEWGEDLMGGEEDRQHLYSLPEIEREAILAERYTKRKEKQERSALKRKMKHRSKSEKGDSQRRSSKRSKPVKGKANALHDLKKKRAKASGQSNYASSSSSSSEEDVAREDSEEEYHAKDEAKKGRDVFSLENRMRMEAPKKVEPLGIEQLHRISLRRDFLERHFAKPRFAEWARGFFVRIGIGRNANGDPQYRCCQIEEVKEGSKLYKFGSQQVKLHLYLRHGKYARNFSMDNVSNHRVTEHEYAKFITEMKTHELEIMTNIEAEEKLRELQEMTNYRFTEEDVKKLLQNKTIINVAAEKARLLNEKQEFEDQGDRTSGGYLLVCQQLNDLVKKDAPKEDKMALINQRNQRSNELRTFESADAELLSSELDPFHRRKTKPTNMFFLRQSVEKLSTEEAALVPAEALVPKLKEEETEKIPLALTANPEQLLKQAHDFHIDLAAGNSKPPLSPGEGAVEAKPEPASKEKKEPKGDKPKKVALSITEYKRRRGVL